MRALTAAVVVLLAAVLGVTPALAAPADRPAAVEAYLDLMDSTLVPAGWTGNVESCVPGTEAADSIEATRTAVNLLRDFAGLAPVTFDAELNRKALNAALMMRAGNALSHEPGPDWPCYTADGDEAAGSSSLFLGLSGPQAMVGYVDDEGVASLGHRRWLLDPRAGTWGTGSTGSSNALYVLGPSAPAPVVPEVTAWPPAGFVPWSLIFKDWSAAIGVPGTVDVSAATVAVTIGGRPAAVSDVTPLEDGYGTGETLSWRVDVLDADRAEDRRVDVTIGNVLVDGTPRDFSYSTDAIVADTPLAPAAAGSRTATTAAIAWQAAAERGVPVTGYRVVGTDGGSGQEFDVTLGPDARQLLQPYAQPGRPLQVRVIPLSRAGSPQVAPITIAPPPPTTPPGGGNGGDPGTGGGGPIPDPSPTGQKGSPRLRVPSIAIRGRRLLITVRTSKRANGDRVRVRIRARHGRAAYRSAVIRKGKAHFKIRLARRHRRARPLKVRISYAGSPVLERASHTFTFR